ncbi:MAG: acetamidase/formamidase family protein [Oscillospiraceae bacterium]|nr:acetamidase/formamidase family protein [Oscillospiraceae bacterium]
MRIIERHLRAGVPNRHFITTPVARIELGEDVIIETATCCQPVVTGPSDVLMERFVEREETGPIFVDGIEVGDMLRINIKKIDVVGHGSGYQYDNGSVELNYDGENCDFIELKDGFAVLPGGFPVPIEPVIGVICVVPETGKCKHDMSNDLKYDLGDNGGNLDYKDVCAGNSVCLKARHKGGLFFLGDSHAAQGWGEWIGMGVECATDITISVDKEDTYKSERPVVVKEKSYACIACGWPYGDAVNKAMCDAIDIFMRLTGATYFDALRYCKMMGDVKNGQLWHLGQKELPWGGPVSDMPVTVGVEIPLPALMRHATGQATC